MNESTPFALLATAIGLACVTHTSVASACSPAQAENHVLIEAGATLPANVLGVPVRLPMLPEERESQVRLMNADGELLDSTISRSKDRDPLVVPDSPFVPGDYRVEIPSREGQTFSADFTVTASAPVPARTISVTVGAPARAEVSVSGGAACVDQYDASVLDVTVRVAEDYRPYRHLAFFEGKKSAPDAFLWTMDGGSAFPPPTKGLPETLTRTYRVARTCEKGAGKGQVTFSVEVHGVEGARAEATVDLDFPSCEVLPAAGPVGSAPPSDGASGDSSSTQGDADGGCSASGRGASARTDAIAFAGIALAMSALARWRRRQAVPECWRDDHR